MFARDVWLITFASRRARRDLSDQAGVPPKIIARSLALGLRKFVLNFLEHYANSVWELIHRFAAQHDGRDFVFCARNHIRLSALNGSAPWPHPPKPLTPVPGSREPPFGRLAMNTQRLARHHEAREALVLSVAGVTAIMLIANLLLLIFY